MSDFHEQFRQVQKVVRRLNTVDRNSDAYPVLCVALLDRLEVLRDADDPALLSKLNRLAEESNRSIVRLTLKAVARNIARNARST